MLVNVLAPMLVRPSAHSTVSNFMMPTYLLPSESIYISYIVTYICVYKKKLKKEIYALSRLHSLQVFSPSHSARLTRSYICRHTVPLLLPSLSAATLCCLSCHHSLVLSRCNSVSLLSPSLSAATLWHFSCHYAATLCHISCHHIKHAVTLCKYHASLYKCRAVLI